MLQVGQQYLDPCNRNEKGINRRDENAVVCPVDCPFPIQGIKGDQMKTKAKKGKPGRPKGSKNKKPGPKPGRKKKAPAPVPITPPAIIPPKTNAVAKWDQERTNLLKTTICKTATESELSFFLELCKATGLNPFLKQIWFVKYTDSKGRIEMMMMAGRDGFLQIANRHPMFDGMDSGVEYQADGKTPAFGWAKVYRKDRSHPATFRAPYGEYTRGSGHKAWGKTPSAMIQKVAEANALKRAFSIDGLAVDEELPVIVPRGSEVIDSRYDDMNELNARPEGKEPEKKKETPKQQSSRETKLQIMRGTWKQLKTLAPKTYTPEKFTIFCGEYGAKDATELKEAQIEDLTGLLNIDLEAMMKAKNGKGESE